ncbi:MAG: helix-turn-helix transcriptional regulator [Lentisphaeria bacterium]|nr:helix-turn-helix transcriptional regulator [Lentisphaeria bacterium]
MSTRSDLTNTAEMLACRDDFPAADVPERSDLAGGYIVHRHDDFELRIILTPQRSRIQRLDVIRPRVCHESLPPAVNRRCISLIFSGSLFDFRYLNTKTVSLRSRFGVSMPDLLHQDVPPAGLEFRLTLALFLLQSDEVRPQNSPVPERLNAIIRSMEQHYYRADLSIASLAEAAGYSPNYLQKLFRDAVGCNPKDYLLKIRMENAMKFLREKQYLVKEISILCGFSDPHYFSNVFRKYYGRSPKEI